MNRATRIAIFLLLANVLHWTLWFLKSDYQSSLLALIFIGSCAILGIANMLFMNNPRWRGEIHHAKKSYL